MEQEAGESIVDEIGVEREGSLKFRDGGVVLALPKQNPSKLGVSQRQARVEVRRSLSQFECAIDCSWIHIVAVERVVICGDVRAGQPRVCASVIGVDRQGLLKQTPCVVERRFSASVDM